MKWKRTLLLVLAFALVGSASAFADDLYNSYKAKPVTIAVNDKTVSTPGLIISSDDKALDSKTMLPARDIADALQALIKWDADSQTVNIYKPNVHIVLLDSKKIPFGVVVKGKQDMYIHAEIDNLLTGIDSFKITITDPYGNEVKKITSVLQDEDKNQSHFWYTSDMLTSDFKYSGNYTLNFYMKADAKGEYALVSQKVIYSIPAK